MSELRVSEGDDASELVAIEIERLRDEVVSQRARTVEGGVNKDGILTLLAEEARRGSRRLPPAELTQLLAERYGYQPRQNGSGETAIRKALFDISRISREWYESHPEHLFCVLFSTSGRIDVFENGLPQPASASEASSSLHPLVKALPGVARDVAGLFPMPMPTVKPTSTWREHLVRTFGRELVESASSTDLSLVSELLYAWTAHGIEMAIRSFEGKIIAVERHPTHDMAAWDGALQWLDNAYREYRLRQGDVTRIVVFEQDPKRRLVEDDDAWNDWVTHVQARLVTDEIRVVLKPQPAWKEAITRDLLILPDTLVFEFGREDFPFSGRAVRGRTAVLSIFSAARAVAACRDFSMVFPITRPLNTDCFTELRKKLRASLTEKRVNAHSA